MARRRLVLPWWPLWIGLVLVSLPVVLALAIDAAPALGQDAVLALTFALFLVWPVTVCLSLVYLLALTAQDVRRRVAALRPGERTREASAADATPDHVDHRETRP
jgi:heme exporter protein D